MVEGFNQRGRTCKPCVVCRRSAWQRVGSRAGVEGERTETSDDCRQLSSKAVCLARDPIAHRTEQPFAAGDKEGTNRSWMFLVSSERSRSRTIVEGRECGSPPHAAMRTGTSCLREVEGCWPWVRAERQGTLVSANTRRRTGLGQGQMGVAVCGAAQTPIAHSGSLALLYSVPRLLTVLVDFSAVFC